MTSRDRATNATKIASDCPLSATAGVPLFDAMRRQTSESSLPPMTMLRRREECHSVRITATNPCGLQFLIGFEVVGAINTYGCSAEKPARPQSREAAVLAAGLTGISNRARPSAAPKAAATARPGATPGAWRA